MDRGLTFTRDATFLNEVANHPDVRPHLGGDNETGSTQSQIDLGPFLAREGNFALVNQWGGFIFEHEGEGVFNFHTEFLPDGRGRRAFAAAIEAEREMFETHGAHVLKTYVPRENLAALGLVRIVGFTQTHQTAEATYWALTKAEWKARRSKRHA